MACDEVSDQFIFGDILLLILLFLPFMLIFLSLKMITKVCNWKFLSSHSH